MHEILNAYLKTHLCHCPQDFLWNFLSTVFLQLVSAQPHQFQVNPAQSYFLQLEPPDSSISTIAGIFHFCKVQLFYFLSSSLTVLPAAQNTNCAMQHAQAVPRICSVTEGFASNQLNNKCYLLLPCQSFLLKFPCAPSSLGCNKKVLAVKALVALLNTLLCSGKLMWMGKNRSPLGTRSRSRNLNSSSWFQSWSHSN